MNSTENRFQNFFRKPINVIACFFLLASIALFTLTVYKSEFVYQSQNHDRFITYYLLAVSLIFFWTLVLRFKYQLRLQIVVISISACVGLYLVEAILIFIKPGVRISDSAAIAKEMEITFDSRSKRQVVQDLIYDGINAVPSVHPSNLLGEPSFSDILPLAGIANATTVYGNESGKYLIYESDRYGFHNPDIVWDSTSVEWLLIGDSFVHGAAVQPGEEIAAQIRSSTGENAISLGIGGNGPLIEYASLVEYGQSVKPKTVLWFYFEANDLTGNIQAEAQHPLLLKYLDDSFSQGLISRQPEIDNEIIDWIKTEQKYRFDILKYIKFSNLRRFIKLDGVQNHYVDLHNEIFFQLLKRTKERVNSWGGDLYFVYLPQFERYLSEKIDQEEFRNKSEVLNLVASLGIKTIDIHKLVFEQQSDPLSLFPFRIDGHYTALGYNLVAKVIIKRAEAKMQ